MTLPKTSQPMQLTPDNYYDHETDFQYMSPSVFKGFLRCEYAELATLKGEYEPSNKDALLVGNFVHTYFENQDAHMTFIRAHPEMVSSRGATKGKLKGMFQQADHMITRLQNEPLFQDFYQGEKESIVTGELFGEMWKGKIDCLNVEDGYFCDLKTTQDIRKLQWSDKYHERVEFVRAYDYLPQMFIYKKLLEQTYDKEFTPIIFAVSKTDPIDLEAIRIDDSRWLFEERWIDNRLPRVMEVLNGEAKPKRCEQCEYCRATKHLTQFVETGSLSR